uniref:Hexosyltransferase n=1 Tax=Acrobeloides nanus TaxID=290746 RepID=A0A914DXR0_9BILA
MDILLFDYIESYSRVPRKIFGFLHYIEQHCPNIKCVVKADSDTVINLRGVEKFCESASGYYGNLKPVRDIKSKWFTPYSVYLKKLWPDFVTGFTYIFSGEGIIPRLMEAIRTKTTFFTSENTRRIFEDVFFTGIAREAAGIQSPVKNWGFHWGNTLCNKPGVISSNENEIGYWKHDGKKYLLAMESRSECQSNCTIEYGWEKFIRVNQNDNFPNTSKCSREMFSLRNFTAVLL